MMVSGCTPQSLRRRLLWRLGASVAAATAIAAGGASTALASGTYSVTGDTLTVRSGPGTSYGPIGTVHRGNVFTLVCQYQNGTNVGGNATWDRVTFSSGLNGVIADYWTSTPSFNSFAPGTGDCNQPQPGPAVTPQMQHAAAWAIAEKNSPDPTWSDHFGHAWSGWCEQFAEQAEGFAFQFGSATSHYQWQAARGRIHTDANPPVGAVVFYGGSNGFGHVAISIGGGQEIGTYGFAGERRPVRQYPVVGFLGNPYLGWAYPIGS